MQCLSPNDAVRENVRHIQENIQRAAEESGRDPEEIRLMAVTKTVEPQRVNAAIAAGVRLLGENKAQELSAKYDSYVQDGVDIHFIGHLQTNKARQVVPLVDMVESLDSLRLAKELEKQCAALGKELGVLLEVNIGGEESKSGVAPEALEELILEVSRLPHLKVQGLMTIPPAGDLLQTEKFFSAMYQLFLDMQHKKMDNVNICTLSMGMSHDYPLAVKHGATIVRVGTAMFGARDYSRK